MFVAKALLQADDRKPSSFISVDKWFPSHDLYVVSARWFGKTIARDSYILHWTQTGHCGRRMKLALLPILIEFDFSLNCFRGIEVAERSTASSDSPAFFISFNSSHNPTPWLTP